MSTSILYKLARAMYRRTFGKFDGTAMSIDQKELGRRLKLARTASKLTQEQVADNIGIARSAVANIERGDRAVSSIELEQLAYLYGRGMNSFFMPVFRDDDALTAHFRANADVDGDPAIAAAIRDCLHLGREMQSLEVVTGVAAVSSGTAQYQLPVPSNNWHALNQGRNVADKERKRLRFDDGRVGDLVDILADQGVRVAVIDLPDDVSGLSLIEPDVGPLIVVNRLHHVHRRSFSIAHEYAHILMDRNVRGMISRSGDKGVLEVRANNFAGAFLMPEEGIRRMIAHYGKSSDSRITGDTPLGDGPMIEGRLPASAAIGISDIALLADHFSVTRIAMINRLRTLKLITPLEYAALQERDRVAGRRIASALGIKEPDHEMERNRFQSRFSKLSMDAYSQGEISAAKLIEHLTGIVGMGRSEAESIVEDLTTDDAS